MFSLRQGLLYRWTEDTILPMPTGRGFSTLIISINATQTNSIFIKLFGHKNVNDVL